VSKRRTADGSSDGFSAVRTCSHMENVRAWIVRQQTLHVRRQFSRTRRLLHLFFDNFLPHFRLAHRPGKSAHSC